MAMKKEKGITNRISNIVLGVLNLKSNDEKPEKGNKPLSDLLQDLYEGMVDAKSSLTYSMAMVGMKRKKLRELIEKQDSFRVQARHFEGQGKGDMAKRLLSQAIALDNTIKSTAGELQSMDTQAKSEIIHFKELERKAEAYKAKIQAAEQMDRFNKIRQQVTSTVNEFDTSVLSVIDSEIEKIEMTNAKLAASIALNAEDEEAIALDHEVQEALGSEALDNEYKLLQAEVQADSSLPPTEENTILLENRPVDEARKLLEKPAFDGILLRK